MRLGGEMRNAREPVLFEQATHQGRVADVALDELDAAAGDERFEASDVGCIGHRVDNDQLVGRPRCAPRMHEVLADKTRAAGD